MVVIFIAGVTFWLNICQMDLTHSGIRMDRLTGRQRDERTDTTVDGVSDLTRPSLEIHARVRKTFFFEVVPMGKDIKTDREKGARLRHGLAKAEREKKNNVNYKEKRLERG